MRVGIVGSGDVGQALGRGFASRGHDVKLGSRTPDSEKLRTWRKETKGTVSTGTFAEAAAHGEVVVLATLGTATEDAIALAEPEHFRGKPVIDATNPLDFSRGMPPGLFVGTTDSLGERVQRMLPEAKVVKCFNTVPNAQMVDPKFRGVAPEMLICGNDAGAKATTTQLLRDFGWPGALDVGTIEAARWHEALVPLWARVGAVLNTWGHGWAVARPES